MRKFPTQKVICKCRNSLRRSVAASAALVLLVSACSPEGEESDGGVAGNGSDEVTEEAIYGNSWILLHVSTRTVDRMISEYGSEDVIDDFQESEQELFGRGVLVEDGEEGVRVELDNDEWREPPPGEGANEINEPLMVFLSNSEVKWCSEPIDGNTFVKEYKNEFYNSFDTEEEYYASMDDYVDCGDGML